MYEDEPELIGYESGDGRPLRSPRRLLVTRLVVILAVVALIVPEFVTQIVVVSNAAQESCRRWVRYEDPGAGHRAAFELFGLGGVGWQCYSVGGFGGGKYIAPLGLIPGPPVLPNQRGTNT